MIFSATNINYKILFAVFGLALGILSIFVPETIIFALLFLAVASIITFVNISLSFSLFIVAMAIIPDIFWSNTFILGAAIFYWFIFILQYYIGRNNGINIQLLPVSLVLYVIFCIISFFTGFGGLDSIRVASILFSAISLSILAANIINTRQKLHRLVLLIFVSLLLTSLYGILQFHTGIEIRTDFVDIMANIGLPGRLYSTMGNPNNFAKFLTMFLPFCISYILITKCNFRRLFLCLFIFPVIIALVLTFSRASYLAIAGIAFLFILFLKPRLIPIAFILALLLIPFLPEVLLMRISTIGTDSSSLYRILIWEGSWRTVQSYWSQGIGIGPAAFVMIYRAYANNMAGNAMHAHNVFLNVWIETGIGGLIAILAYNFSTFRRGVTAFFNEESDLKFYFVGGLSSLAGFIMFSLVEHVWFYPRTMLTYFISMGIIWATINIQQKERGITK